MTNDLAALSEAAKGQEPEHLFNEWADFTYALAVAYRSGDLVLIERAGEVEQRLLDGVQQIGLHDDNNTELFDVSDADDAMAEGAALISSLRAENERARQEGWNAAIAAVCAEFDGCDELDVVSIVRALASDAKGEG